MNDDKLNERLRKIFEARHGKVWTSTDICEAWKHHHENCGGCKHEKKCENFVKWELSILYGNDPEKYLDDPSKYKLGDGPNNLPC